MCKTNNHLRRTFRSCVGVSRQVAIEEHAFEEFDALWRALARTLADDVTAGLYLIWLLPLGKFAETAYENYCLHSYVCSDIYSPSG